MNYEKIIKDSLKCEIEIEDIKLECHFMKRLKNDLIRNVKKIDDNTCRNNSKNDLIRNTKEVEEF